MSDAVDRGITVTEMAPMVQAIDVSPETTAAFVGRTLRGPLNEPVLVQDVGEFRRRFGEMWSRSSLGPAVRQFFAHGGRRLFIVRVANNARGAMLCLPAAGSALVLRAVEPGSTETIRAAVDLDRLADSDADRFNLTLQRVDPATGHVIDQEHHRRVSYLEESDAFVADALLSSALVRVERPYPLHRPEPTQGRLAATAIPYVGHTQDGTDGEELSDYDLIGCRDDRTGLFALAGVDKLDMLYLPPPGKAREAGPASLLVAEQFCRDRGAMLVIDPQLAWETPEQAAAGVRKFGLSSANAVSYFPRMIERGDEDQTPRPVGGAIAGMLCKLDRTRGPWVPLDYEDHGFERELIPALQLDEHHIQHLARHGLNAIAPTTRGRARVAGSVTMDPGREPQRAILPVRRLCLRILHAIEEGTRWSVFEPDPVRAVEIVHAQVNAYLSALQGIGAVEPGYVSVEAERSSGVMILVGFRPAGWGESLSFTLHQTTAGCRMAPTAFAPIMESCA